MRFTITTQLAYVARTTAKIATARELCSFHGQRHTTKHGQRHTRDLSGVVCHSVDRIALELLEVEPPARAAVTWGVDRDPKLRAGAERVTECLKLDASLDELAQKLPPQYQSIHSHSEKNL